VFLHPSVTTPLGQVEGWGVALAEAAASGLPVVATRSGGIPDQVVDGVTGLLVDEHDVEGLARAMEELAEDPELRQRMGVAGRANIHEVGNVQTQLAKLGDVLEQAAHGRPE
jgi:glycosyltransferase involved in cell wall biosynthesis